MQEQIKYEEEAMKALDYFTPIQNAELDIESLTKKYVCPDDECGKVFFD